MVTNFATELEGTNFISVYTPLATMHEKVMSVFICTAGEHVSVYTPLATMHEKVMSVFICTAGEHVSADKQN